METVENGKEHEDQCRGEIRYQTNRLTAAHFPLPVREGVEVNTKK